jgi:hypothetical protein
MKNTRSFLKSLIVCGLALAMVSTLSAQTLQGKAKVVRVKGHARYSVAGSGWQPLKVGDVLRPGSVIQTGLERDSFVDLVLGDGMAPIADSSGGGPASAFQPSPVVNRQPKAEQNVVRVFENSVLGIDKLSSMETGADTVSETQLDLQRGHVFGSVKKMSAASKYEVKLPNGVAGIRGTIYDITSDGVIRVAAGSVVLAYMGSDGSVITQLVNAGQQFDARSGQLTPIPTDMLHEMLGWERGLLAGGGTLGEPTSFVVDRTIYRVSLSPVEQPTPGGP